MVKDSTQPDWTPRIIATFAMVLVLAGGLLSFNEANGVAEAPATVVATSCSGFAADARKLFDMGDTRTLSGTFAPGDHVHLAIDFKGIGYSWKLTGVLGAAKTDMTGSGWYDAITMSTSTTTTSGSNSPRTTVDTTFESAVSPSGTSISTTPTTSTKSYVSRGDIGGLARLDVDVDVTTAGDGAITINETGSVSLLLPPRVAVASCTASNNARALPHGEVSSSGPVRGVSAPLG